MKVLSEVDGVHCLVVRSSSFLSIKTKDHSSLLGESLWGDRKGEEFIVSIGAGCKSESISCRFLCSVNDGSKQAVLLKIKVFKQAK